MGADLGRKVHLTWGEHFAMQGGIRTVFTSADVPSPVSDRDTDVVQASGSDIREIRFSDELLPPNTHRKPSKRVFAKKRAGEGLTLSQ